VDVQISTTSPSAVDDAEQAVRLAREALEDAHRATRAAESVLRDRRAEEAEARRMFDRAAELVKELYVAERQRLEEAARLADAALKQLDDKLQALRPGEADPGADHAVTIGHPAAVDGATEAGSDATAERPPAEHHSAEDPSADAAADADAEDWLATLQRESENERRASDGA
jgi:hypothetical protein